MEWRLTINLLILFAATAFSMKLAHYAWSRRPTTGATLFALMMLALSQWILAYTLALTSSDLAGKLVWVKFQYLGMSILPAAWLTFVLEFTGKEQWLTRRNVVLLAFIPTLSFLLAATNDIHSLFWKQVDVTAGSASMLSLSFINGIGYWVHTGFSYGCLLAATAILVRCWRRETTTLYRGQAGVLLFVSTVPWFSHLLLFAGITSYDLTTFSFLIGAMALVHYVLRFGLFDITPIAHRAIVNSMTDGVWVLDTQNRIADVNAKAEAIVGQPANEMIGKSLDLVWPNLLPGRSAAAESPVEIRVDTEGPSEYYEVNRAPVHDHRGRLRGSLLSMHSITHRKMLERTREDMAHTMIHELRDPLSNALFALEMLKGDISAADLPESTQLLELTFDQTMKTLHLVDTLLEIGRLKNGIEMVVTLASFPIEEVVTQVASALGRPASKAGQRIRTVLPDGLPPAWADTAIIQRVLQNLVANSIEFSPQGSVIEIEVAAAEHPLTGERELHITVKDEGPGIPEALQQKVFEKFWSGSSKGSGRGLGLAFCQMAVKAHGQRIWVESLPGEGAAFTFTLPIAFEPALLVAAGK